LEERLAHLLAYHLEIFRAIDDCAICIPPSWDLVRRTYIGPNPCAAGFAAEIYATRYNCIPGEDAKAEFPVIFQQTGIGGILIGDINNGLTSGWPPHLADATSSLFTRGEPGCTTMRIVRNKYRPYSY
jgi:hypothetical protein